MGKTILVVEDESLVAMEIQEYLVDMGYSVPEIVSSGDMVLAACLRVKPDLIVMDIKLKSFIDGIDAAQRVRMIRDIPIIYLTAYATNDVYSRAKMTNPVAYLVKPLDEESLGREVRKVLG